MDPQPKKFDLNSQNNDLKLYAFTVQKGPHITIIPNEDFCLIIAYNHPDAINEVKKLYPGIPALVMNKRLEMNVKKIVDNLNLEGMVPKEIHVETAPEPTPEKKVENFLYNLMLLGDEFIKNEKDKSTLKSIIKRIKKVNEDESKGTTTYTPETTSQAG